MKVCVAVDADGNVIGKANSLSVLTSNLARRVNSGEKFKVQRTFFIDTAWLDAAAREKLDRPYGQFGPLVTARLACTCGATWSYLNIPQSAWTVIVALWESVHMGEGHKPCSVRTAARRRASGRRETTKLFRESHCVPGTGSGLGNPDGSPTEGSQGAAAAGPPGASGLGRRTGHGRSTASSQGT